MFTGIIQKVDILLDKLERLIGLLERLVEQHEHNS